jgi:hypothetical protein
MTPTSTVTPPTSAQPLTAEQVTTGRRLEAVREILRALETATAAGQQHLMMKVLGLLRREAPAGDHWMDENQWNKIAAGLEALAHEAARMAPDADAFKRHATLVADALTVS